MLTPCQRFLCGGHIAGTHLKAIDQGFAADVVERLKEEAGQRQKAGKDATGQAGGRGRKKNLRQKIGEGFVEPTHTNDTIEIRARSAGTNRRYLQAADFLLDTAPEKLCAENAAEVQKAEAEAEKRKQQAKGKPRGVKASVVEFVPPETSHHTRLSSTHTRPGCRHESEVSGTGEGFAGAGSAKAGTRQTRRARRPSGEPEGGRPPAAESGRVSRGRGGTREEEDPSPTNWGRVWRSQTRQRDH